MKRILIINRLGIGDVVLTTPLAQLIKQEFGYRVGMMVAAKARDLLKNHPYIDDVFVYSKKTKAEMLQAIRRQGYTDALLVDERFSSTLLAWQAGCRILNYGFEISLGPSRWFCRRKRALRAVEDYAAHLKSLAPQRQQWPCVPEPVLGELAADERQAVDAWFAAQFTTSEPVVLLVPRGIAENKNWPQAHLGWLTQRLNERGIKPVYLGGEGDIPYIKNIPGEKRLAAGIFSLRQSAYAARRACVALTPCTGAMHMMATAGTPLVALYGPTDPARWAPRQATVLRAELPCIPCEVLTCNRATPYECMQAITPQQVWTVLEQYLSIQE